MLDLTHEVIKILANGLVVGSVILSAHIIQKRVEGRKDRHDYASVIPDGVKRILGVNTSDKFILQYKIDPIDIKTSSRGSDKTPIINACQGMTYSGNIRH